MHKHGAIAARKTIVAIFQLSFPSSQKSYWGRNDCLTKRCNTLIEVGLVWPGQSRLVDLSDSVLLRLVRSDQYQLNVFILRHWFSLLLVSGCVFALLPTWSRSLVLLPFNAIMCMFIIERLNCVGGDGWEPFGPRVVEFVLSWLSHTSSLQFCAEFLMAAHLLSLSLAPK